MVEIIMLSPIERHDKLVRATDLDALSCRLCASKKSYFDPPDPYIESLVQGYNNYLQYCTGYSALSANRQLKASFRSKKLPLINRGTYLRTKSIDLVVEKFIEEFPDCQIISLGSGSDTRAFKYLQTNSLVYHEMDYDESVRIKKLAILGDVHLKKIVQYSDNEMIVPSSSEEFKKLNPEIHSPKYHLHSFDLRNLKKGTNLKNFASLASHIDLQKPTLILSECVLCYLSPTEYQEVLSFWRQEFEHSTHPVSFLIYEPMSLNDAFGRTMNDNLSSRGINLMTFNEYPTLQSRLELFKSLGFDKIRLTSIKDVGEIQDDKSWLDQKEVMRLNKLELIDEVEEIRLLFDHYCLCYAEVSGHRTCKSIDTWKWTIQ